MSNIRTIASLPEDLHTLCISDLGYASEVHDENDDIRARLHAAFGNISGLDADDLDKLTIKDALRLTVAIGQQDDNEGRPLIDYGGAGLHSLRSTPVSKLDLADYVSANKEMRYLHDELDKKGRDWLRMTSTVPEDKRQSSSGYQDHLQAIMKQAIEWKPTEGTEGADLLRVQLRQRQGIQRVYSEALLRSALQSSLPSFIVSVKTQVESRLKTKKTKKTKKGLGESAMNELDTISQVIKDIADQTLAPSSEVIESCKEALTKYPLKEDGDDLFFRLISEDGKRHTKLGDDCTLADASVYSNAVKRYVQERQDSFVKEQGEHETLTTFAACRYLHADPRRSHPHHDHPAVERRVFDVWRVVLRQGREKAIPTCRCLHIILGTDARWVSGRHVDGPSEAAGSLPQRRDHGLQSALESRLILHSTSDERLALQLELVGEEAWKRFFNDVHDRSAEAWGRLDVSEAEFERTDNDKGKRWVGALVESGNVDVDQFGGYYDAAETALKEYKEGAITLDELDTRLDLPEAPVRPDVSHLDPEYSFNSHREYRKSLPAEDCFVEINDLQIGGYTNSSIAKTDEGTGTSSQLTHSSKESSKPGSSATRTSRKKPRRKPFTADQLAAQHQKAREKEESKLTYAEMLSKPAPTAVDGTEESKGTEVMWELSGSQNVL